MDNTTIITALYNINREHNGDGRKWSEYIEWFKNTLKIPLPMVIYIDDEELIEIVNMYRNKNIQTKIVFQKIFNIPYAYYEDTFTKILNEPYYKSTIRNPDRVECKLPFYNIIQYSKFKWLEKEAIENTFNSDYFFWIDAGISRFIDINNYYKIKNKLELPNNKLVIQHNNLLNRYSINEQYLWDSQCLMCGTMFGGDKEIICNISNIIDIELKKKVANGWINNEQILLAYIYSKNTQLFELVLNNTQKHLCLFEKIFI